MSKKVTNKKGGLGQVLFYLSFIVIAFFYFYQPSSSFAKYKVESKTTTKVEQQTQEESIAEKDRTQKETNAPQNRNTNETAFSREGLEIPAPIKGGSEIIIKHTGYTVSFNKNTNMPNWVAWELTPKRTMKKVGRTNKFLPDPRLPQRMAVTTDDYRSSGYDRGHMCPAGDNTWNIKAMQESFYMTNMCPQVGNLNRGDWKELEDACREWVKKDKRLYIVCGPIIYKGKRKLIGRKHKVVVPDAFFKVILCLDSKPQKAIGFIYKNTNSNKPIMSYVNSVDEVERITGYDFFPNLPDELEDKLEREKNIRLWRN